MQRGLEATWLNLTPLEQTCPVNREAAQWLDVPRIGDGWAVLPRVLSYLANPEWCKHVRDGSYREERLGVTQ